MTTEPLLTISAFARAVDLAPSTLRYYDEAGLLPPAEVDPRTGYRYYTPELTRRAHLLRRMREVGVPVESMRLVLDGPPERSAEILRGFAERAARNARDAAAAVEEVVSALQGEESAPQSVTVTLDGAELGAAVRRVSTAAADDHESPLSGVLLETDGSGLTVVATDRYRMASWTVPTAEAQTSQRRGFVRLDLVEETVDWLAGRDCVTVELGVDRLLLSGREGSRTVSLDADRFPAYRLILDGQPNPVGRVTFAREPLAAFTAAADGGHVRLAVGDRRLSVSRDDHEGIHLPSVRAGAATTLVFSAGLLRATLDSLVGSQVTMTYAAHDRPVRFSPVEQRRLGVLLMPVRPEP